nr:hypothetical protein [Tanacetum cinerariifolium]
MNMSAENKAHFQAKKEAIHLILTGIGDEIYSTVDACQTAQEMWEAIERLQQGEFTSHDGETIESYYTRFYKLMNEMIRNNLTVATMQVNVKFLQQLQPEWSRFVKIVKQQHKLDEVSYHKLFDILKQYQKEVNELRAERLARNANPLAFVATAQANQDPYYQTSKSHKSYAPSSKPSISTRNHTTTRYKGKEIARPITPPSETASEEEINLNKLKGIRTCRRILLSLQSTSKRSTNLPTTTSELPQTQGTRMWIRLHGSLVVQQSGIQCFNCKEFGHFAKECRKPKRTRMKKINEHELEAHYSYMGKIQEAPTADSGTDSVPLEQNEQNDVESDDERVALANLIANLKLDVDENKKIQKQLKKANTTLAQELKECKTILAEASKTLGKSNSVRDSCLVALQNKQTEFEKYKAFNDRTIDYDKLKRKLNETLRQLAQKDIEIKEELVDNAWINHSKDQFCAPTAQDMDILIQTCLLPLAIKTQNDSFIFVHELKQEMHAVLKYIESLEKEIDKLESHKAEFSSMYDVILQECVSTDVMCSYLLSLSDLDALAELQCLYLHKVKECDCLAQKLSKQTESVRMYRINNMTTQTRAPQSPRTIRNTNPCVSTSTRLNHITNVSRPQHKSNQLSDKVMPNNSHVKVKKTQVEDQPRIPSISNKMKSVTVCKDSLTSRTLNANDVCATCNKCLVDSNHFACVTKMLNDMNARTKKPNVVPISTRKPKGHANKSVATPHQKKVASKSTNLKPQSFFRMLYEKTRKTWKWWIEQQSPSGYKWVPKRKMKWIPKAKKENV